jgi:hypothetical protein
VVNNLLYVYEDQDPLTWPIQQKLKLFEYNIYIFTYLFYYYNWTINFIKYYFIILLNISQRACNQKQLF